ncbi:MAG: lipopolysaccharide core heptose(I) kinase RfaP [Deltaproteobacteria bacterium]|nr:lipopolysaccharide core heptose(I) kinase RfaP [Deltaproteobacteria bacterium]MBW1950912.1 lipopolysaccharide core heptose(I) kinase RfaP [Deltaproteobacteria bacterium]MBW2008550.1 lipopolysaccharide core heptose(I) kinase RfaP [Deltaproteobacteria bacterium]MBW2103977.1 lipopolysaccharide core heptose(I) kinase RfaP [Deltaproteobacteria bacterium]MBW2349490.1 lipopolysaccharide core heptose(I) kinase RfaP [Deltaproteobacteria bacterium]
MVSTSDLGWEGRDLFQKVFSLQGRVYRTQKGRRTLRFTQQGRAYFAKIHEGVGWREIFKNLLAARLPVLSARNEWRAIRRFETVGIPTTPLVAYGMRGLDPARLQSFVITREIQGAVSLEDLCRDWPQRPPAPRLKRDLILGVAGIARTLHENGMNHRDFYLCHFLVREGREPGGGLPLYLIDLHRVQIRKTVPTRWRVKDVAGLYFSAMEAGLTRHDLLRFVRAYEARPLQKCFAENGVFWRRVEKKALALYKKIHGRRPPVAPGMR